MKTRGVVILVMLGALLPPCLLAKEKRQAGPAAPIGWLCLDSGPRDASVSEGDLQRASRHLPRGALLAVFRTKDRRGDQYAQVGAFNFATGSSDLGWVRIKPEELKPASSYPVDGDLLRLLGAPYLDDFTSEHTDVVRFLVRQSLGPPVLVGYVFTAPLSFAKLVLFTLSDGKYQLGEALNIPLSEIQGGISAIEVRDLVGDASDCLVTREPFRDQAQTYGTNLKIRKVVDGRFQVVWQAPIEYQNLSQYSPKMQILKPPELNIGAAGTVATGEVTFRPNGKGEEPVWKGKVEFYVFGRERPVDTVNIEKACPWDGKEFTPLR